MSRGFKLLLVTILSLLLLSACKQTPQTTPVPTTPATIDTSTPPPTQGSKAYTATPPPATQTPVAGFNSLHMTDAQNGWAWDANGRLLHTADGGQTWVDRTPPGYQFTDSGFFLDAQTAWLPVYLSDNNQFGLLHTADGGQSWLQYPQGPASGLHFADALHGWAVSGDVGAGNVYFSLSQTSDGGKTWAAIPVKPQSPEPGLPPGTIHLCNICNDAFYYDPARMLIAYGDLGSMEPGGALRLQVSFDLGNTWQTIDLPLPAAESAALVAPNPPVFSVGGQGLLPIHLLKTSPDGSFGEQRLVFYATSDGGASWTQLPTLLDGVAAFTPIDVVAAQDAFVICGSSLCASHDGANTWQQVASNFDFTSTDTRAVTSLDFVNGTTGWLLVNENEANNLYATTDGGAHWTQLSPLMAHGAPPSVTIDTTIPTPTPVPSDTPQPTPMASETYDAQCNCDRLTFAPNATWAEIDGAVSDTTGTRYILSAMQYQVMSVSIAEGAPFTVQVSGADGKTLTDPQNPQFYWRGGLPSTQDYVIKVTSQVQGPFTLRLAINPPGLAQQYFEFIDPQTGALLDYSDEFAPISWQLPFTTKGTPLLSLYFIEPTYYYPTTNLNEAGLLLASSSDPSTVSTCTQPGQPGETAMGQVTIHGFTFTKSEFVGAAAGNRYDQLFYRTVAEGRCFEVIFLIHSAEIGNYPPGTVVEYYRDQLLHQFESVLDTFNIK